MQRLLDHLFKHYEGVLKFLFTNLIGVQYFK